MSETYETLARLAAGLRLRGDWAFLPSRADVRYLPRDTQRVLAGLRERFSDDALEAAGLLTQNGDGPRDLCVNLRTSPRIFVVLRAAPDATPYDLLGPCGSLAGQSVPCLTAATDAFTAAALRNWRRRLFVAFDIRATAILRRLGLPATLATGLDRLDGVGLRSLLGQPQGLRQVEADWSVSGPTQRAALWDSVDKLVLVGWSIARLNGRKPRGLQAVASLLGGARYCFGFDTSRIMVWQPTELELQQLHLAVKLQDRELVRQVMGHSVASSLCDIERYANDHPGVSAREGFRRAREALLEELQHEQEQQLLSPWTPKRLETYSRSFERAFVEPLARESASVDSPMDQAMLLAASELMQEWLNTSSIVTGCREHTSRRLLPWTVPMEPELLKRRLKIVDRLIAIRRERRKG